jgi:hypothetical protein
LDWGAGNGRDSLYFSSRTKSVLAIDQSVEAVRSINNYATANHIANLSAINLDIAKDSNFSELYRNTATIHYSRFFLHALADEALIKYFQILKEIATPSDQIFAEFRAKTEKPISYSWGGHMRWLRDPNFVENLALEFGFRSHSQEIGFGLAVFKSEDPYIARFHWVIQ